MENNLTNKTKAMSIFWWTIKRYIPVSIAYWILLAFALPMVETFMAIVVTAEIKDFTEYVDIMKESAIYIAGTGYAAIAVLFSIIVGIIAFSYMHNKRSVDFFGSLPVSRRTMFFSRYVATILLTIIPVIIFGVIGICLSGSFVAAGSIMKVIGYIILATIGNITIIGFISLCCGSVVDIMISYIAINIAFPICIAVFNFFPSSVIPGMGENIWPASIYTLFCPVASVFTMEFGNGKVFGIIWWIILIALAVVGSYVVCKKRKAEMAQNTQTFSAVEVVVKFIVCSLAGLGLGWIMAYVGTAHKTIQAQYVYFVIGLVAGIIVANILLHLIYHRGLVKFSKSLVECGIILTVCGIYTFVIATGLFGYDINMPERNEIKGVSLVSGIEDKFYVDGENILVDIETEDEKINEIYDIHQKIIDENKKNQKWWLYPLTGMSITAGYVTSGYDVTEATIIYELSDGTQFTRNYSYGEVGVKIDEKLFTDSTNKNLIDVIPNKYIQSIYLNTLQDGTNGYFELAQNEAKIVEALKKDLTTYGEIKKEEAIGYIEIEYEDGKYNWHYESIYFNDKYINTMKTLKEMGYSNFKYSYFNELYLINGGYSSKTDREIYFRLPEGMDPNKEIRCIQGYRYDGAYMFNISDKRTLCEHVRDNIWKYTLYDAKDEEAKYYKNYMQGIIICQVEEDTVIDTGMILLDKDNANNLLTIGDRRLNAKGKPTKNDYWTPIYNYEWTKYEE